MYSITWSGLDTMYCRFFLTMGIFLYCIDGDKVCRKCHFVHSFILVLSANHCINSNGQWKYQLIIMSSQLELAYLFFHVLLNPLALIYTIMISDCSLLNALWYFVSKMQPQKCFDFFPILSLSVCIFHSYIFVDYVSVLFT